jgi:hypothetical protein
VIWFALAFGTPAPAQIDRISRQILRGQLLADPQILSAVRIKSGEDNDYAACFFLRAATSG